MENYKFTRQPNHLEPFNPSGNEFFDSLILKKRNEFDLFWNEAKEGNDNLSIPKRLESEIETLEFLSKLYNSIKKSGKTYDQYIETVPNFEQKLEEDFGLTTQEFDWINEFKGIFKKINKE